jgi:mono/diheme cytochrome c family protein
MERRGAVRTPESSGRGRRAIPGALVAALAIALLSAHASARDEVEAGIAKKLLAERIAFEASGRKLKDAGIRLGTWLRIGPLRDQGPLINWMDNVASSFKHTFELESDARANENAPLLTKIYAAPNFPATPKGTRSWCSQPEWIDGYYQELPRGPAPSSGETQFVYRTITVDKPVTADIDFIIRAPESDRRMGGHGMEHWRRTGRYAWFVNGQEIRRWEGQGNMAPRATVELKKGTNHFLAKITNNRHAYGFAFAIHGLHPTPRREVGFEQCWRPFKIYAASDVPFHREAPESPSWFVKQSSWLGSLDASLDGLWKERTGGKAAVPAAARSRVRSKGGDIMIADFEGRDYGSWKATGDAFGPRPAKGTLGGQQKVTGFEGRGLVNTFLRADGSTGTLTSPEFTIERPYLTFLIGGGNHRNTCMQLLIGKKVVDQRSGRGNELLLPDYFDVAKHQGRRARLRIVDEHKGGWGHVNVDHIVQSSKKPKVTKRKKKAAPPAPEVDKLWAALTSAFEDSTHRAEISLMGEVCRKLGDRIVDPRERPAVLGREMIDRLAGASGVPASAIRTDLGVTGDGAAEYRKIARAYFKAARYRDSLERLLDLKFRPEPMPGVETAARDASGNVVAALEKTLAGYPTSREGDRHLGRLDALRRRVEPLIKKLTTSGDSPSPRADEVLAAGVALDRMWNDTIGELPPLLFVERPTYGHDAMQFTGSGGSPAYIKTFDPRSREVKTLYHDPRLRVHDILLSWDAKTVFTGGGGQIAAVGVDGEGFRRIARGQSPCQTPDGRIVFFDDDVGQSPCKGGGPRRILFICDPDGENRKVVSANLTIDNTPTMMNDGRVIFARWDYGVNKNVFNRHAIWTQNPDGTAVDLFFGNTVIDPRAFYRPRQVPGRPEIVAIFGPHHQNVAGLMGLIWPGKGRETADGAGFRRLTHDTASVGDRAPVWSFQDPWPLNEQLFLVSFGGGAKRKVGIHLVDRAGNRKCIFEAARDLGAHCAQPFLKRPKPPVVVDRSKSPNWKPKVDLHERLLTDPDWTQKGTLLLQDVYLGIEPEVKRGRVKYLAVMEQATQSHGRGGAMGVGTIWYANRCVGLVPVEKDGSAHFEVPALRSLYFHALDKDGRMLMTQGSDFHVMPGEFRSCVGCHEQRKGLTAPPRSRPIAARKAPFRPKMPDWGTNGIIEYEAVVQPVLDKYCTRCHSGAQPKGRLNLTGDRTTVYNMSYMELTDRMLVHFTPGTGRTHAQPSNDYDEQAPLSRGSLLSKMADHLQDPKHSEKRIPFDDQLAVFLWIDSNVPFYSHYRQKSPTHLQAAARKELQGIHRKRCASCHTNDRPDTKSGLNENHTQVHAGGRPGEWGIARSGMRVRHMNLTTPAHSAALQAPLAKSGGGWGLCQEKSGKTVFGSKSDPDYRKILEALGKVDRRNEPGVKELLTKRRAGKTAGTK